MYFGRLMSNAEEKQREVKKDLKNINL